MSETLRNQNHPLVMNVNVAMFDGLMNLIDSSVTAPFSSHGFSSSETVGRLRNGCSSMARRHNAFITKNTTFRSALPEESSRQETPHL